MNMAIFLKKLLKVVNPLPAVVALALCCSIPAHAGNPKPFDKYDPPTDLILTLPDQALAAEKTGDSLLRNAAAQNNNETQASALKTVPVNVNCNVDVIQNTVGDVPLSNRIFGECGLHYHY